MNWSNYQEGIFNFVSKENGNGAGIAVAGSGKTTVAVESMKLIPHHLEGLFATFARDIATVLAERVKEYKHISTGTYNSLGWRICLNNLNPRPKLDEDKTINILKYDIFNGCNNSEDEKRFKKYKGIVKRIISLLKGQNCQNEYAVMEEYPKLIDYHNLTVPQEAWFPSMIIDTYKRSLEVTHYMDYDDQKFMPLFLALPIPQYDFLVVDEFQDTNILENTLIMKSCPEGRKLIIGDPQQSIYKFRGAVPDTMDHFITEMNAKRLPLYICYRCSKAVIREAQKIVSYIEPFEKAVEGSVNTIEYKELFNLVKPNDFVLCRTTAPVVRYILKEIGRGRTAYVKGKNLGDDTLDLINQVNSFDFTPIEIFNNQLSTYCMNKSIQYAKFNAEKRLTELQDNVEVLQAIMIDCTTIGQLKAKVGTIFKESGTGICGMTIHKSKGLETSVNNDVFILRPDLLPHPKGDQAEEMRIKYVATTRCRRDLYYVLKDPSER